MKEKTLRMFKLVTGEQIIAMAENQIEISQWILTKPKLVLGRPHGLTPLVGPDWIPGLKSGIDIYPLEWKYAMLTYYAVDIDISLQDQYAAITNQ